MAPAPPGSLHAGMLKKKSPKGIFGGWQKRYVWYEKGTANPYGARGMGPTVPPQQRLNCSATLVECGTDLLCERDDDRGHGHGDTGLWC